MTGQNSYPEQRRRVLHLMCSLHRGLQHFGPAERMQREQTHALKLHRGGHRTRNGAGNVVKLEVEKYLVPHQRQLPDYRRPLCCK